MIMSLQDMLVKHCTNQTKKINHVDLFSLPLGTEFFVTNGYWFGTIIEKTPNYILIDNGVKKITITTKDHYDYDVIVCLEIPAQSKIERK